MRAHNAEVLKLADFTDITTAPAAGAGTVGSPVGAALTAVSSAVKTEQKDRRERVQSLRKFAGDVADLVDPAPNEFEAESAKEDFSAEGLL